MLNDPLFQADLHCHSVISDGTLTPEALAERAAKNGVNLWALTDHDELGGIGRARYAAKEHGMRYLTGVEISVSFAEKTVHIVGLGFDEKSQVLVSGLAQMRRGRLIRAQQISDALAKVGIKKALDGALQYAGNPELISRSHFARHLIATGVCPDMNTVFRKYLTEGNPGYVPHHWVKLREAVEWIVASGGHAVIAHPGRYRFTPNIEYAFFLDFKNFGGRAVEVVTGSHTPDQFHTYSQMAKELGLAASCGSDFHCPTESRVDLGRLPTFSSSVQPVWELLEDRIE